MSNWIVILDVRTEEGIQVEATGSYTERKYADDFADEQFQRPDVERVVVTTLQVPPLAVRWEMAGLGSYPVREPASSGPPDLMSEDPKDLFNILKQGENDA